MISIQAYRSTIGSFYSRAARHSDCRKSDDFTHRRRDHDDMFCNNDENNTFYFLKTLIIISFIITLTCNVSLASLKLMLLLSGDIESHPGPYTTDANFDTDFQIALNESYAASLLNDNTLAHQVVANARKIGLDNITYDVLTLGDGNCFYHAIVQQLRRPELRQYVDSDLRFDDHLKLRMAVVNFIRQNNDAELFRNYREVFTTSLQHNDITWEQILQSQERNSVYVEELFIRATAIMLNVNILVTSENNICSVFIIYVNDTVCFISDICFLIQ